MQRSRRGKKKVSNRIQMTRKKNKKKKRLVKRKLGQKTNKKRKPYSKLRSVNLGLLKGHVLAWEPLGAVENPLFLWCYMEMI